jgi:hypothetical protein
MLGKVMSGYVRLDQVRPDSDRLGQVSSDSIKFFQVTPRKER